MGWNWEAFLFTCNTDHHPIGWNWEAFLSLCNTDLHPIGWNWEIGFSFSVQHWSSPNRLELGSFSFSVQHWSSLNRLELGGFSFSVQHWSSPNRLELGGFSFPVQHWSSPNKLELGGFSFSMQHWSSPNRLELGGFSFSGQHWSSPNRLELGGFSFSVQHWSSLNRLELGGFSFSVHKGLTFHTYHTHTLPQLHLNWVQLRTQFLYQFMMKVGLPIQWWPIYTDGELKMVGHFLTCTSHGLNKNCLLRLDFSMMSISVTVTLPSGLHPKPIMAKFFSNSQPIAPAPTYHTNKTGIMLMLLFKSSNNF